MTWGRYTSGALTEVDPNTVPEPGKLYESRLRLNRDITVHEQAAAESSILREYNVYRNVDVKYISFVTGSPQEVVVQFTPKPVMRLFAITLGVIITALVAAVVVVAIVGAIIVTGTVVYSVAVGVTRFLPIAIGLVLIGGSAYVVYRIWKGRGVPRPKIPKIPKKITIPKVELPKYGGK